MRTTLNLPKDLLKRAQHALHAKTKTETIILGLKHVLQLEKTRGLLAMRGNIPLTLSLKKSRERI